MCCLHPSLHTATINKMKTQPPAMGEGIQPGTPAQPSQRLVRDNAILSSSPAFETREIPVRPRTSDSHAAAAVLPVLLPPASLRPLAFRTVTKKHNLTLASSALQALAAFIGKHCGAGWREEGLAEQVLEEVAKSWKKSGGGVIVEADGDKLHDILKAVSGCMAGGRILQGRAISRQSSFAASGQERQVPERPLVSREDSQTNLGLSNLALNGAVEVDDDEGHSMDPRSWLKVVGAFDQPKIVYNAQKNHFEKDGSKPSLFPPALARTRLFHYRYHMVLQRILRNEAYQRPSMNKQQVPSLLRSASSAVTFQNIYKITTIVNMLGRSGSQFLLFGLLTVAPTGELAISDVTGTIVLDLGQAKAVPDVGLRFTPGMFVLVEGIYQDEYNSAGGVLGNSGGVGGTIGGRFNGLQLKSPPCERRPTGGAPSSSNPSGQSSSAGGLGWVDLLGVGSERAAGPKMRRIEKRVFDQLSGIPDRDKGRGRIAFLGQVNLECPVTLRALKCVLQEYEAQLPEYPPVAIVLMGHFVDNPAMAGTQNSDCVEYKECFNTLASILSEVPQLLQSTTFVFVPSDNDPWPSTFSAGASTVVPRKPVPELFTSRIKRVFAEAKAGLGLEAGNSLGGKAVWTTNPARLSLFGPAQEIVLFRDDMLARLRRNAVHLPTSRGQTAAERGDGSISQFLEGSHPSRDEAMDIDPPPPLSGSDGSSPDQASASPDSLAQQPNNNPSNKDTATALATTLLDQGYLSPFPLSIRPVLWDYVSSLNLYPLPTALVMVDPDLPPATLDHEGCLFMNPGPLLDPTTTTTSTTTTTQQHDRLAHWCEYDAQTKAGRIVELGFDMRVG